MKELKQVLINNLLVAYSVEGQGEPIILLHGWGSSGNAFAKIQNELANTHRVYTLDFPGFGASEEPAEVWGCDEYANLVHSFVIKLSIITPTIIAHSFGGRIAITLSKQITFKKLILTGSAGLILNKKERKGVSNYLFNIAKTVQKVIPDKLSNILRERVIQQIGSADYKISSFRMREILKKVVSEDLTRYVVNINTPTLLVWGELDNDTPLGMAKAFNKLISGSKLVIIPNAGHYAFVDEPNLFLDVVKDFIAL
jgi:pimeloyl-ACP methyl ester carboxylesterase